VEEKSLEARLQESRRRLEGLGQESPSGHVILVWVKRCGHYMGVPQRGLVPKSGPAPWQYLSGAVSILLIPESSTVNGISPWVSNAAKAVREVVPLRTER
jgi:hypothetical protein